MTNDSSNGNASPKPEAPIMSGVSLEEPIQPQQTAPNLFEVEETPPPPVTTPVEEELSLSNDVFPESLVSDKKEDTFEDILKQFQEAADRGEIETVNYDKMPLGIALSSQEKMEAFKFREVVANQDTLQAVLADMTSPLQSIMATDSYFTVNRSLLLNALQNLGENIGKSLTRAIQGVGDSPANVSKKYEGQKTISITGNEGLMAMTALTGGMRRVRLYNSGIYINIRNIPISDLNAYYREVNTTDFEYGKAFGAFYYMFSDLTITEYIIENLLPLVICGSNYRHWKDMDKLRQVICFQDFHTILWAMGLMMHPSGVDVNFICAEEGCGHITTERVDLAKMRLFNQELINEDMLDILKKPGWLEDSDLAAYREKCNMNTPIVFSYDIGGSLRKWKLNMKQASLFDYEMVGKDYNAELRRHCSVKNKTEVNQYTMFNFYRSLKPWIQSLELTVDNGSGEQTFIVQNNGTEENDKIVYMLLDEFQANAGNIIENNEKSLDEMIKDYILNTKISHICFYFPECPRCHTVPKNSHHGYIPYDPMQSFFTLALMKLLQGASKRDTRSISKDTTNS